MPQTGFEPASLPLDSEWQSSILPLSHSDLQLYAFDFDMSSSPFHCNIILEKVMPSPGLEPPTRWSAVGNVTTSPFVLIPVMLLFGSVMIGRVREALRTWSCMFNMALVWTRIPVHSFTRMRQQLASVVFRMDLTWKFCLISNAPLWDMSEAWIRWSEILTLEYEPLLAGSFTPGSFYGSQTLHPNGLAHFILSHGLCFYLSTSNLLPDQPQYA